MKINETSRQVGYGTGTTEIVIDEYIVDNIDADINTLAEKIDYIISYMHEDMQTIDDMQSKYLDVVSDEIGIIKGELEDLLEATYMAAANNTEIYEVFLEGDRKQKEGI